MNTSGDANNYKGFAGLVNETMSEIMKQQYLINFQNEKNLTNRSNTEKPNTYADFKKDPDNHVAFQIRSII